MGTLLIPADVPIADTWQGHKDRNPPSAEPGTDYATAYGTDIAMCEAGRVSVIDTSPYGGEGRRLSIDLDNGQRVSYIHLSQIMTSVGTRVARGQKGLALSGASGNGSDWYYGPHVHVSLWPEPNMNYRDTIDFQKYVGDPPTPDDPDDGEVVEMALGGFAYVRSTDGLTVRYITDTTSGYWFEWSQSQIKNSDVARAFGINGQFANISQGGRNAMFNAAADVRAAGQAAMSADDVTGAFRD